MRFEHISREQFLAVELEPRLDAFAKTFRAKADAMDLWPLAVGMVERGGVCSALVLRISKHEPYIANLQLLHTFASHRRRGLAAQLTQKEYARAYKLGAQYFRVSSEPEAVAFYRALGLKFWGEQKSGCLLCMHRIVSPDLAQGRYVLDPIIEGALSSGRRGSLVLQYDKVV